MQNTTRRIQDDALTALNTAVAEFAGWSYERLTPMADQPVHSRDIKIGDRTYRVLISVSPDQGPQGAHFLINFDVDDGGVGMFSPINRWFCVHPGETLSLE